MWNALPGVTKYPLCLALNRHPDFFCFGVNNTLLSLTNNVFQPVGLRFGLVELVLDLSELSSHLLLSQFSLIWKAVEGGNIAALRLKKAL